MKDVKKPDMNKEKLVKEFRSMGIKTKQTQPLLHSFAIIEKVASEIHRRPEEILAAYEISRVP